MAARGSGVEAPPRHATPREDQGANSVAGRPNFLNPGTVLQGRYHIQDVLDVGGMSTVYRARDLRFSGVERLCAVKDMFNAGDHARLRQMRLTNFQREAALLATLTHPAFPASTTSSSISRRSTSCSS